MAKPKDKEPKTRTPRVLVSDPAHLRSLYDVLRSDWFTLLDMIREQAEEKGSLKEQLEAGRINAQDWVNTVALYEERTVKAEERAVKAEERLLEMENALNWQTTCLSCAKVLDSAYRETVRAEQAESARDRYKSAWKSACLRVLRAKSRA